MIPRLQLKYNNKVSRSQRLWRAVLAPCMRSSRLNLLMKSPAKWLIYKHLVYFKMVVTEVNNNSRPAAGNQAQHQQEAVADADLLVVVTASVTWLR